MPLNFTAAHSSRISKPSTRRPPLLKRSASTPFADLRRAKALQRSLSKPEAVDEEGDFPDERLEDISLVRALTTDLSLRDVAQIIQHVRSHMFDVLPQNSGFNSVRIAETLNFRKALPPTVTLAHVHALTSSPTKTEKEIVELTRAGVIRRVTVPGRGIGGSSVGEGLVLSKDVVDSVIGASEIGEDLAGKFISTLQRTPMAATMSSDEFLQHEIACLMRAGFITSSAQVPRSMKFSDSIQTATSGSITSIPTISRAASGSLDAIGGDDAISGAGGHGGIRRGSSNIDSQPDALSAQIIAGSQELQICLPNMGPYFKLLTAARSHLISLIMKSRFKEIPEYLLRERWNGGISGDNPAAKAKKYRGEFSGVLASNTRKWRQFYGLSFDWILAECFGSGLIEVFETGSIGRAIRLI